MEFLPQRKCSSLEIHVWFCTVYNSSFLFAQFKENRFFFLVGQRSVISTALHTFQFSLMKGRFIDDGKGLGSTQYTVTASTVFFYSYSYWRPFPEDAKPNPYLIEESKSLHHTHHLYQLTLNPAHGFVVTQPRKKLFAFNFMSQLYREQI